MVVSIIEILMSNFKDCFFLGINEKAFWNGRAQQDQEMCQIFLFLIKATSKLSLKTTLWSNPRHSCKEFLFVRFKVLFVFSLCSSNVHVCAHTCLYIVRACVAGRSPPYKRLGTKRWNDYLPTPVHKHTPWKCVCARAHCIRKQNTHSCQATESEGQQMKASRSDWQWEGGRQLN